MTTIHRLTSSLMLLLLVHTSLLWTPSTAFVVVVKPFTTSVATQQSSSRMTTIRRTMSESSTTESAFVPLDGGDDGDDEDYDDEVPLETIESLGRGAAKAKRGKRKGSSASTSTSNRPKVNLAPEEIYYEGPPAITETIVPTLSIITVVGIIPAAAAWARQAWVRYKITSRRIRVTSGLGGKDMAEIVYPDIVEIRTAKRLFGDGDMVAFLRDGAKFEMRNIPEFEASMEFILKQCDPDVVRKYREGGDVTKAPDGSE